MWIHNPLVCLLWPNWVKIAQHLAPARNRTNYHKPTASQWYRYFYIYKPHLRTYRLVPDDFGAREWLVANAQPNMSTDEGGAVLGASQNAASGRQRGAGAVAPDGGQYQEGGVSTGGANNTANWSWHSHNNRRPRLNAQSETVSYRDRVQSGLMADKEYGICGSIIPWSACFGQIGSRLHNTSLRLETGPITISLLPNNDIGISIFINPFWGLTALYQMTLVPGNGS